MLNLAVRNLKIFFRDKASVFFSFLSVIIIIGLYVLFLGDVITAGMDEMPGVRFLMDSWIASGLMAVTSITSTMGAFGIMVEDRARKNSRDFLTAPLKRSTIAGGYVVSTYLIGVIISLVTLVLIEVYIVAYGRQYSPLFQPFKGGGADSAVRAFLKRDGILYHKLFQEHERFLHSKHCVGYAHWIFDGNIHTHRRTAGIHRLDYKDIPCFPFSAALSAGFHG